jgi:hypothetical protein
MNIDEIRKELEFWPDQKLYDEVMNPTGAADGQTYLIVLETHRRTRERESYQARLATQESPDTTVTEEVMAEFGGGQPMGGIPDVDPNLMQNQMQDQIMAQQMPQQQMPQQQMPQQMPQGPPMAMRGGGAIRYQGGEYIDPNLTALGLTIDEEGNIVPLEIGGYGGLMGLGGVGEGGWLLDYDPFQEAIEDPTAKNISLAGLEGALAGGKSFAAKKVLGYGRRKLAGSAGKIKDKFRGATDRLRSRLGGTRTSTTTPEVMDVLGSTTPRIIKPTSLAGRATDVILDHPIIAGSIAAGVGLPPVIEAISGARVPKAEAEDIPFTSEETAELSSLLNDAAVNLRNLKFGEGGYAEFKNSDPRDQLAFLRSAKVEGKMSKPSVLNTPLNAGAMAASRSNIMDEISKMLGSGEQAVRDQQSAALIQLGAGIAGGDIAGGLSAAGREVSALKAARSSEKLKAIMALIEMEYKQGLLNVAQVENIIAEIELLQEAVVQEGTEEKINELYQRLRQHAGGSSTTGLSSVSSSWAT